MEETLNNLSSPAWWITALLSGVVASLIAAYAKPLLDSLTGKLSSTYKAKNQARIDKFNDKVSSLRKNIDMQIFTVAEANYHRLRAMNFFLMAITSILTFIAFEEVLPEGMLIALGIFFLATMLAAYTDMTSAQKLKLIVDHSRSEN